MSNGEMTEAEFRRNYPRRVYDGKGGSKIINSPDELTEGWSFDPYPERRKARAENAVEEAVVTDPDQTPAPQKASALATLQAEYGDVTRDEIKAELTERGVKFAKNASTETLADLMLKELANDDGAGDH